MIDTYTGKVRDWHFGPNGEIIRGDVVPYSPAPGWSLAHGWLIRSNVRARDLDKKCFARSAPELGDPSS